MSRNPVRWADPERAAKNREAQRKRQARYQAQGRCACGRPPYIDKNGKTRARCAYCMDLTAWIHRTRDLEMDISEAGERPRAEDYADGKRRLRPLQRRHRGRRLDF